MEKSFIYGAGIKLRAPGWDIDPAKTWKVLSLISDRFPQLTNSDTYDNGASFRIFSLDEKNEKAFSVSFGKDSFGFFKKDAKKDHMDVTKAMLEIISGNVNINPLSIEYFDLRLFIEWSTKLNHTNVLFNVLHVDALQKLYKDSQPSVYLPYSRAFIDVENSIQVILSFESSASQNNEKLKVYPDAQLLTGLFGLAKTGNFSQKQTMLESFQPLMDKFEPYFTDKYQTIIENPISQYIEKLELEIC